SLYARPHRRVLRFSVTCESRADALPENWKRLQILDEKLRFDEGALQSFDDPCGPPMIHCSPPMIHCDPKMTDRVPKITDRDPRTANAIR
ncbi:MAG: hypothetical protein ACXW28_09580, partial [Thermoanaerobaculia bacterium]